jgi:uncharacterized protein (DUF1330 family)
MKTNHKLALAVLSGIAMGVAGVTAIHAQQIKTQPGYVIAEVDVTDAAAMKKYGEKVADTMAPFNHHFVVRGGKPEALEGDQPKSIVMIAFDSVEQAHAWYDSPAYQEIKPIRQSAAKSRIFIVEGVAAQ